MVVRALPVYDRLDGDSLEPDLSRLSVEIHQGGIAADVVRERFAHLLPERAEGSQIVLGDTDRCGRCDAQVSLDAAAPLLMVDLARPGTDRLGLTGLLVCGLRRRFA